MERFITSSIALIVMGLCLQASLRLLYGARGPAPDDSVHLFMRILSWGLLLIPAAILFVAGANWLSVLLFIALLEALLELILGRRALQRRAAWHLLAASGGSGRPAVESLRFHQVRFTGLVGRWYRRLVSDLDRGVGWQQAIWSNRRALPPEAPALAGVIDFGSTGAPVRGDLLDDSRDPAFQEARRQIVQRFVYLASVVAIMGGVLTFIMIKIIPSFQAIFEDFSMELPRVTVSLISFANVSQAAPIAGVLVTLLVALALVCTLAALLYLCDVPVLQPLVDKVAFTRVRAHVLRLLAAAIEHGKPIDVAIQQLYAGWSAYPSGVGRRRLAKAHANIEAGQPWQDALVHYHLLTVADAALLKTAQDVGNLPWAMRMLADRMMRLSAFRWTVAQQMLFTLVILLFGALVLWVCVAMIYPLATLIYNLA